MILFFLKEPGTIYAVETDRQLHDLDINKLTWLFSGAVFTNKSEINGNYTGPRREMITPWSTNAVEITQNMGIAGIKRIEEFRSADNENRPQQASVSGGSAPTAFASADGNAKPLFDPMLQRLYHGLDGNIFVIDKDPDEVILIDDIEEYNRQEGLALSNEEISYLNSVSSQINRKLTDSEIFGFSQVNSEHCRHKIFNGIFVIDGKEKPYSLFQLIRQTTEANPNRVVSAYKDNCAFLKGPVARQFAPASQDRPDWFEVKDVRDGSFTQGGDS
jgi:phosphoribosylformylglycinamidine synthase